MGLMEISPHDVAWQSYVYGLQAYVISDGFGARRSALKAMAGLFNATADQIDGVHDYVLYGGFWKGLLAGEYFIAESIPHPRNLVGCSYMTSTEIRMLLNVDLCAQDGTFTSL